MKEGYFYAPYIIQNNGLELSDKYGTFWYNNSGEIIKQHLTELGRKRDRKNKIKRILDEN